MRVTKFSVPQILNVLNKVTSGRVIYDDYDHYWYDSKDVGHPEDQLNLVSGDLLQVATEIHTLSPKDLNTGLDNVDMGHLKDLMVEIFSPYEVWEFDNLFSDEHLDTILMAVHAQILQLIKKEPHKYLNQDINAFFSVESFTEVVYEDGVWRASTETDLLERKRNMALHKLTLEEQQLLGLTK